MTEIRTCAVGPCQQPRAEGSSFCPSHGPMTGRGKGGPTLVDNQRGTTNAALLCPHCDTRGHVRAKPVRVKRGISGGKATGAVLTAGVSLFATGLSRKEAHTEMYCGNCRTTWVV